jgi:hypothetical protein
VLCEAASAINRPALPPQSAKSAHSVAVKIYFIGSGGISGYSRSDCSDCAGSMRHAEFTTHAATSAFNFVEPINGGSDYRTGGESANSID